MHDSGKVKCHFGDNFILFVKGVVDLVINEVNVELYQLIWYFL
jgi:hypothetical protein